MTIQQKIGIMRNFSISATTVAQKILLYLLGSVWCSLVNAELMVMWIMLNNFNRIEEHTKSASVSILRLRTYKPIRNEVQFYMHERTVHQILLISLNFVLFRDYRDQLMKQLRELVLSSDRHKQNRLDSHIIA